MLSYLRQHPLYHLWMRNKHWRWKAKVGTLLSCCNKLCDIAPEILIGVAVDCVVKREESFLARVLQTDSLTTLLITLGILTFIVWSLESLFEYLQKICWRNLAQHVQHSLRMDAFSHSLRRNLSWFEQETTGNYVTTLSEDIHQLERFLDKGADTIIQLICSTFLILCVFFYISPLLALLSFLPMPFIMLWSRYFHHKLLRLYQATRSHGEHIAQKLSSVFSGIMVVKSFHREQYEIQKIESLSENYVQAQRDAIRVSSAFTPTVRIFILIGFLVTLVGGGYLSLFGHLAVGAYSAMVYLTQRLLWPFTELAQIIDDYQRAMASTHRILRFVSPSPALSEQPAPPPSSPSTPTPTPAPSSSPTTPELSLQNTTEIRLENVSFSYPSSPTLLKNITLSACKGEIIGICGATGSGKSTLAKLLLRFYTPSQGRIFFDNRDSARCSTEHIRQAIAFVSQDAYLFDGSIHDNLIYGSDTASADLLQHILSICALDSWIASLPEGPSTLIGERGVRVSGGQRQRIALARALLKQAPILILDEATSAIDNDTEKDLSRAIYNSAQEKITLIIAHRLSTIRHAHRIYVLDKGRIQESGTHDELCAQEGGIYKNLWHIQTAGGPALTYAEQENAESKERTEERNQKD